MGLMDRVKGGVRHMWSPITVWMADQGSDTLVHAGQPAKVVVAVRGQDDGTAQRVELTLSVATDNSTDKRTWGLGEAPATIGVHEVEVMIPTELPPSCARFAAYSFGAKLHRSKGFPSDAGALVDVVSRPQDAYWPEGPRTGQDGAADPQITIALDAPTVDEGTTLTGRVTIAAAGDLRPEDVDLALEATVVTREKPQGKTRKAVETRLARDTKIAVGEPLELPFSIDVPLGVPPTLQAGVSSVVWRVRVDVGKASGWALVAVLDPQSSTGTREQASSSSLLDFLDLFS